VVSGESLFMAGYPESLPLKIVTNGKVKPSLGMLDNESGARTNSKLIYHDLINHLINSGSPIFDAAGYQVGILSGGGNGLFATETGNGCNDWATCDDSGTNCTDWFVAYDLSNIVDRLDVIDESVVNQASKE